MKPLRLSACLSACLATSAIALIAAPAVAQTALEDRVSDSLDWIFDDGELSYGALRTDEATGDVVIENLSYTEGSRTLDIAEVAIDAIAYDGAWWSGMDGITLRGLVMTEREDRFEVALLDLTNPGLSWAPLLDLIRSDDMTADGELTLARYLLGLDVDELTVEGVAFDKDDTVMGFDRLRIAGFASALDERYPGDTPLPEDDALFAEYLLSASLDAFSLEGVRFEDDEFSMTLASFTESGYARGVLERFTLDGLVMTGDESDFEGRFQIGRLDLAGIRLGEIIETIEGIERMEFPGFFWAPYDHVEVTDLAFASDMVTVHMPRYRVEAPAEALDGTIRQTGEMNDFTIEFGPELLREEAIQRLGIEVIEIDASGDLVYDPSTRIIDIDGGIDAGDLGALHIDYALGNLDESLVMGRGGNLMSLMGATLVAVEVSYDERGFLRPLLGLAAEEEGVSVDALIDRLLDDMRGSGKGTGDEPDMSSFVVDFGNFLRQGGTLVISVAPPAPLPIATMQSVRDPIRDLGLSLRHVP